MAWDGREASSGDTGFPAYEGAAWALVHWMSKERPEGLARLRAALQRGIALDVAWSDAFPDVSLGAIDATVRAYLRSPDRRLWWVALESIPRTPARVQPVSAAELAQLRGELSQGAPESIGTTR